jgi:hypothetical protein
VGDGYYAGASSTGSTIVQLTTTLVYTGAGTADYGDAVVLKAHLAAQDGSLPARASVVFTLGTQGCRALVDSMGDATCTVTRLADATVTSVSAHYGGSSDSVYLPSDSGSQPFKVTPEETTLSLSAPAAAQAGSTVTVHATLLEDGTTPVDMANRTVTFSYGGETCTGASSCTFTASALGPVTVSASFAGDSEYAHADAAATTLYVYAPTPGGGMFVVGDRSAPMNGTVAFWGSRWSMQNALSLAVAPSSFKGYAANGTTTCGSSWSTDPGNSTPPPPAPLPSYIAVLVASSASKSGAAITGNTARVVVVHTASYDANPGHPGTGTVVATVCP